MRYPQIIPALVLTLALSFVFASPARAADPDIKKLYAAYKAGYAELAKLPADHPIVKKAKNELMERFRGAMGTEFTVLFYLAFKGPVNGAKDTALATLKGLDAQFKASEAAVKALKKLKKELTPVVAKLEKRIPLLNTGWTTANTTVNRLVGRIRALGGQASLENFDVRYAYYPGRPLMDAIGRGERSMIAAGAVRFAGCPPSCSLPSKDGGSSSGNISNAAKAAVSSGFSNASNSLTSSDLNEIKSYVRGNGPKGLQNFPSIDEMKQRATLRNLMPKLPVLPAPPANLPTPEKAANGLISGLQGQLKTAREARDEFAKQRSDATAALAEAKGALGPIPARLAAAEKRVKAFKPELDKLKPRLKRLKLKRVIWADSIKFGKTTADQLFTKAKTTFTTNATLFGKKVTVKTTFDFKDPKKSMKAVLDKLRAHKSYKNTVEG